MSLYYSTFKSPAAPKPTRIARRPSPPTGAEQGSLCLDGSLVRHYKGNWRSNRSDLELLSKLLDSRSGPRGFPHPCGIPLLRKIEVPTSARMALLPCTIWATPSNTIANPLWHRHEAVCCLPGRTRFLLLSMFRPSMRLKPECRSARLASG
jgi:hypothetical protein